MVKAIGKSSSAIDSMYGTQTQALKCADERERRVAALAHECKSVGLHTAVENLVCNHFQRLQGMHSDGMHAKPCS